MEAKDIRIGNIVKLISHSGIKGIINEIGTHYNRPYIRCKDVHNGIYLNHEGRELVEGIPLSENWLIRFGFKKQMLSDNSGYYYTLELNNNKSCDLAISSGDKNGFVEATLFPYDDFFRYKYVHELQNLVFSITGKELELKIDT